jgi:hypothetical protein
MPSEIRVEAHTGREGEGERRRGRERGREMEGGREGGKEGGREENVTMRERGRERARERASEGSSDLRVVAHARSLTNPHPPTRAWMPTRGCLVRKRIRKSLARASQAVSEFHICVYTRARTSSALTLTSARVRLHTHARGFLARASQEVS